MSARYPYGHFVDNSDFTSAARLVLQEGGTAVLVGQVNAEVHLSEID